MAPRSDPPPSYPPPAPSRSSMHDPYPGWRPADDDVSLEAIDWRARTSLRRVDRALTAIEKLTTTVEAWSASSDRHWRTISRLAWVVIPPLIVAFLASVAALVWNWISTLHH